MKVLSTYCQLKFLENIFANIPGAPFNNVIFDENNDYQDWIYLCEIIFSNSMLYIDDINGLVEKSKNNPFFQKLINRNNSGGSIINEESLIDSINDDNDFVCKIKPTSLHYYNDDLINANVGLFFETANTWRNSIRNISARKSFSIHRDNRFCTFPGWNFIDNLKLRLPTNAAIISDRYFLQRENNYQNNIYSILNNILPLELTNCSFHLSIITRFDNIYKFDQAYNSINNYLIRSFNYKIDFTLYNAGRDCPHDRDIVTNYYRLNSGNSFDYYNRNGNIICNTQLEYFALNSESQNNHSLKLKLFKEVMIKSESIGPKKNRLIQNI